MLNLNSSYCILKGWPKIQKYVDENKTSITAYIIDKSELSSYILTNEEFEKRTATRKEIEQKLEELKTSASTGNNDQLKNLWNLNYMSFADDEGNSYPAEKIVEIFKQQNQTFEITIDDYVKQLLVEYNSKNIILKTPVYRASEEPIFIIKK